MTGPTLADGQIVKPKTLEQQIVEHMLASAVGPHDRVLPQIVARARSMPVADRIVMETEMRMRERHRAALDADYDPCAVR